MQNQILKNLDLKHIWHPCTQMKDHETLPLIPIKKAKGVWLYDFDDKAYCERLKERMETRLDFIQAQDHLKDGYHALPQETAELMRKIVNQLS